MNKLLLFIAVLALCSSCATKKQIIYFQDAPDLESITDSQVFEPIVEENDVLYISVSSMDPVVVAPFTRTLTQSNNANQNPLLQGYLVNSEGKIQFPVLGDISVVGKTRMEIEALLKADLSNYVKDVVVDVRIMNFKVTVIGEVNNPGVYRIQDERVTLPQAIGRAGDLSEDGNRTEVLVLREENGKQVVGRIDFTQTDFFESPFYFLKQNDVVYVQPSLKGVKKSGFIPDIPALLSLFTVVLSTVIILTR